MTTPAQPAFPGMQPQPLLNWFNTPTKHATWLLKDFLPAESLVMVSGPRKRGFKTWFSLWLSAIAASGQAHTAGRRVHKEEAKNDTELRPGYTFEPTGVAPVLFLEEEGTAVGLKERVGKILLGQLGPSVVNLQRLAVGDTEDWTLGFHQAAVGAAAQQMPFWVLHRPRMKLDNPIRVAALLDICKQIKPRVIVLDALTYMHNAEENDMRGMQAVNDGLAGLRAATGATIMYICHTNKEAQRPGAPGSLVERDIDLDVRGSSVLLDAYEAHFGFRRWKPGTLTLVARYREREEQTFDVRWIIPPKSAVLPVQLQMIKV